MPLAPLPPLSLPPEARQTRKGRVRALLFALLMLMLVMMLLVLLLLRLRRDADAFVVVARWKRGLVSLLF